MKKNHTLHRISAFAFSMLPLGIALENKLWLGLISFATILPLILIVIHAVSATRSEKTSFLSSFYGVDYNFIDVFIAGLGIVNCWVVGLKTLSLIWIVSLCCILVDWYLKRTKTRNA